MSSVRFKEAEFFVQTDSLAVGREQQEDTYPFRDKTTFADLGLKSRRFPLRAYVLSDSPSVPQAKSAQEKAHTLMEACQSKGSGWLTLPWLGKFRVVNTKCQLTRPQGQARRIEFALEFIEAGEITPFIQTLQSLNTDALGDGLSETFASSLKPLEAEQKAAWQEALNQAGDSLKTELPFLSDFNHLARTLLRAGGSLSALLAPLSQIERSLSVLKDSITSLINKPDEFAQSFLTLARQMASLAADLGIHSTATASHQQVQISTLLDSIKAVSFSETKNPLAHNIQSLKQFKMLTHMSLALEQASQFKPAFRDQGEAIARHLLETTDQILAQQSPFSLSQQATVQGLLEAATFEALNALHQNTSKALKAKRLKLEAATPLLILVFETKTETKRLLENNRQLFNPLTIQPQIEIIL